MFQEPGHRGPCPACGGQYTLFPSHRRGEDSARKIVCEHCGRAAVIVDCWVARILVVSGMDAIRDGICSMLTQAGHDAYAVANGDRAMQSYRDGAADVVIVDVSDPAKLDGRDVVRHLETEFPEVRVLAMSAPARAGVADPLAAARRLGARRTIRIPFSASDLLGVIEQLRR